MGARASNADCKSGLDLSSEFALLLGGAAHHGFITQGRITAGLQYERCDGPTSLLGLRVSFLGEGMNYSQSQNAGVGIDVEVSRQFGDAVLGLRYGMAYRPDRYESYLGGFRYRKHDAFAAIDIGAVRTPNPDGPGMRIGTGVLVGGGLRFGPKVSAVLVVLAGVVTLAVGAAAPRT